MPRETKSRRVCSIPENLRFIPEGSVKLFFADASGGGRLNVQIPGIYTDRSCALAIEFIETAMRIQGGLGRACR